MGEDISAGPEGGRPSLALITPWGALCGIAAYSHHFKAALDARFDITVLPLEEDVLQSSHARLVKVGDELIERYCRRLAEFDYVNIQLEYGTIGSAPKQIYRRLMRLFEAAPNLTVTFHTILHVPTYPLGEIVKRLARLKFGQAWMLHRNVANGRLLSLKLFREMQRMQRRKPVKAFVHTQREWRRISLQEGLDHVYHHPLAFLDRANVKLIRTSTGRHSFPALKALPADAVVLGVFGFISPYKNFEFVVEALRSLPPNYHLAIFGAVNPKSISERESRAQDLNGLFSAGRFDQTLDDDLLHAWLGREAQRTGIPTSPTAIAAAASVVEPPGPAVWSAEIAAMRARPRVEHPGNLSGRVHFLGAMNDDDYFRGMNACDVVVFPYLEVGQTSSGPISQAVELGCRVLAARNRAFLEFAKYHPGRIDLYDIGNVVEFAEKAQLALARPRLATAPRYTCETSAALYAQALTCTDTTPRPPIEVLEGQDSIWGAAAPDEVEDDVAAFSRPGLRAIGPAA